MSTRSSHSRFNSSLFEFQSNPNSPDNIPLAPAFTTGSEATEEPPLDPPFARPRKKPGRNFWRHPCSLNTLTFLGDLLLTLAPCLFLLHSFLALSVNNEPVSSSLGQKVEQAAKIAPTLFPVVFAAVVGGFMRTYALWRAERGSSLGVLELLNGSQNLLAAFERAVLLPGLGFLGISVILLWGLSPVGGQSALRVLSRKILSSSNTTIIYYFKSPVKYWGGPFDDSDDFWSYKASLTATFQASLTSIKQVKGRDIWGHVKIPVLQDVPSYTEGQNKGDWYDFDENEYDSPYSSMTGLLISGLKENMKTNFNVESSYFNLTCTEPVFFYPGQDEVLGGFATWVGTLANRGNDSSRLLSFDSIPWTSYMIDSNYQISTRAEPRYNIIYASRGTSSRDEIAAYNCTVGLYHVESAVTCVNDCRVTKIRPSHHANWSDSGWPWPDISGGQPLILFNWLETLNIDGEWGEIGPLDYYVRGYNDPYFFPAGSSADYGISYRNVSELDFAKRLQSLINTGWHIGLQGPAIGKTAEKNKTALVLSTGPEYTFLSNKGGVGYPVSATNATTIEEHDIFASNMIWISFTVIVSLILLACGITSMVFKYRTRSPDILGFVSSMTRDNPNFEQIPHGDQLDGLERARVLRHMKVQIVDAKPWDSDGSVSLIPLDEARS